MAIKHTMNVGQGEALLRNITMANYEDLDGYTVTFEAGFRQRFVQELDVDGNVILVRITDEITDTWGEGKYQYQVVLTDPFGTRTWLVFGDLNVRGRK